MELQLWDRGADAVLYIRLFPHLTAKRVVRGFPLLSVVVLRNGTDQEKEKFPN